ncbi:hypothetical protein [Paraflavitalea sp. CAU 1676]|uniref:hypothetical protein n=1 Tax=Paraflavitalea sp. CAU 1676 TaxID=3032598 RepID=UPI0023DBA939|nr:hypothetical protein [Paraflavitalea sp. CAU 1676]MDF2190278.1 hypothetical protein [Paraflavitalea sp. CAU 1676]
MSKPVINNYEDLIREQERLRKQLDVKKQELNGRIREVKEKLAPVGTILSAIGGITALGAKNPAIKTGIGLAVDMLVKKKLFKGSGLLTGLIGSFLVRNVATRVAAGAAGVIIGGLVKKFASRKKEPTAKPE